MPVSFLAREAGRVHVCGHRGYSLHYPENTMPALEAAKAAGATTVEIDVVLTRSGEPVLLHDLVVDRTTDGHGFAAVLTLAELRRLDAGVRFDPRFAGTKVPLLAEALDWAKREDMGIVLELKEKVAAGGAIAASAAGPGAVGTSESEVMGALQALGYTAGEARDAARQAVAALPATASLEDRVKAALGVLRQA